MQAITIMGEWLDEAVRAMRARSKAAPIHLAGCADGWTMRVGVALPQRAAPERQCEVGCLLPATLTPPDLQLAVRGNGHVPAGLLDLTVDAAGVRNAGQLLLARDPAGAVLRVDPLTGQEPLGELARDQFCRAAHFVAPAAVRNEYRPVLEGVSLQPAPGGWVMVATDSYVLRMAPVGGSLAGEPVVVARAFVERLAREAARGASGAPLRLTRTEDAVVGWVDDEWYVAGPLLHGEYPHVEALFPAEADVTWTCEQPALAEALAALGDVPDPMVMTYADGDLVFTAGDRRATLAASGHGHPITPTGLNRAFLRRIVADLDEGSVIMSHAGHLRALQITQGDLQALQMPVSLPKEHA